MLRCLVAVAILVVVVVVVVVVGGGGGGGGGGGVGRGRGERSAAATAVLVVVMGNMTVYCNDSEAAEVRVINVSTCSLSSTAAVMNNCHVQPVVYLT